MPEHKTLNNRVIQYDEPPRKVATFIRTLKSATTDPTVSYDDVLANVYGDENPLLERDATTGRAVVTAAVLDNPLFRVMTDLLGVKAVETGRIDLAAAHAKYTVSIPDAGKQLGVTEQAIRAAVDAWRLPALYNKGRWWLTPEAVASYQVSNRRKSGRTAAADVHDKAPNVRCGGKDGASLSIRVAKGDLVDVHKEGAATVGRFPKAWKSAVIKTTTEAGTRAFEIEPADELGEIKHRDFYVRGQFRIVRRHNATKAANEAWKAASA